MFINIIGEDKREFFLKALNYQDEIIGNLHFYFANLHHETFEKYC